MWLISALLAPILFALVHVVDSHFVKHVFEKPWMVTVTSAVSAFMVFIIAPFFLPFAHWHLPPTSIILIALVTGCLIQLNQTMYFYALSHSEAGIVAAYWNITPALVALSNFLFFGELLTAAQYLAIVVLITASVFICLCDSNLHGRWNSLGFALIGTTVYTMELLLMKVVFSAVDFSLGFILISCGLVLAGLSPLLLRTKRRQIKNNLFKIRPIFRLFLLIEGMNLLGYCAIELAVMLGSPSLVSAIETTTPGFVFVLSMVLASMSSVYGNPHTRHRLVVKFGSVAAMTLGVWLLAQT